MSPTPPPPSTEPRAHLGVRILLIAAGAVALALGVIGAVLPLLPTTPFVLLAAGCFARASPPAHRWMRANPYFGPICRSGAEGRYLPPRAKLVAVALTLASFSVTVFLFLEPWPLRVLVGTLGLVLTTWLARLPTAPASAPERVRSEASPRD